MEKIFLSNSNRVSICENGNLLISTNDTKQIENTENPEYYGKKDFQYNLFKDFCNLRDKCNLLDLDLQFQLIERDFTKICYCVVFHDTNKFDLSDANEKQYKQFELVSEFVNNILKSVICCFFKNWKINLDNENFRFKNHYDLTESGYNVYQKINGDNFEGFLITSTDE